MEHVEEAILVATHRLDDRLAKTVMDACGKAHARPIPWSGETAPKSTRKQPVLLVSTLGKGERRIPDDIFDFAANRMPGLAVLLLCEEQLLRPMMTLHDGLVTLVGPPLSAEKITSSIRLVLADRVGGRATDTMRGVAPNESPYVTQRVARSDLWLGMLGPRKESASGKRVMPTSTPRSPQGASVLIPGPGEPPADQRILARALECLGTDNRATAEATLTELLGNRYGLIHLDRRAGEWGMYWPQTSWPLWMFSQLRLPNRWNLAAALESMKKRVHFMPANSSDLVAGLSGAAPLAVQRDRTGAAAERAGHDADEVTLTKALSLGGPGLLDALEQSAAGDAKPFCAAVLEVRG